MPLHNVHRAPCQTRATATARAGLRHERVEAFSSFASEVVDYVAPEGNIVAVAAQVHNMAAMQAAMETPEMAAAKEAHGVVEPVSLFIEKG